MIIGKISPGSGLGDQLFSYIITRVIALDKGYEFGFVGKEFFKGKDFMDLDWGKESDLAYRIEENTGALNIVPLNVGRMQQYIKEFVLDKPYYDPDVNFIEDGTVIDGYGAQDERYWGHRLDEIRDWLEVKPLKVDDDKVILNIRGGEFRTVPELFLPVEYWKEGMDYLPMRPEIHTDDLELAKEWFPEILAIKDIELNWRTLRYAKNIILSNSAFGIIPALLNENAKYIIAPRYWNRRNLGRWDWPMNYYKKFTYI